MNPQADHQAQQGGQIRSQIRTCLRVGPGRHPVGLALSLALIAGCATTPQAGTTVAAAHATKPAERVEIEPLQLAVVGTGANRHVEAIDATTLFEQAGAALQAEKWDEAAAGYDGVVARFPGSRYVVASLYNAGLALEGKKDFAGAAARYRRLIDQHGQTRDALDALFRMGACLAEVGNWAASAEAFSQVLAHPEIVTEDRIEAMTRRGLGQYHMKDAQAAERTFRETLAFYREKEALERVDNVFFVAMSQYYLGEIAHEQFRALPVRLPERQMKKDLESKAELLLVTQARYLDVARLKNAAWSTAAGYQMATLYKEFYDAVMEAPLPKMTEEMRQVYYEELRKEIEPLLRKAIHMHELTQQVAERNGVDNEWVKKSTAELEQLRALVTPEVAPPGKEPRLRPVPQRPELEKMQPPPVPPHHEDSRGRTVM